MIRLMLAVFVLLSAVVARAQVRIGNGGEGIWLSSTEFFLLDLYESGAHFDPYFGSATPFFQAESQNLWPGLKADRDLIARKLSDFERVYPGLGYYALAAAKLLKLRYMSMNESLVPFYPEDSELQYYYGRGMGVRFSTIAVRRKSLIIINSEFWSALSPEHRIALLLHEVLFSMAKLDCRWSDKWCTQFSPDARKVVGDLFSKTKWDTEETRRLIAHRLRVPDSRRFCAHSQMRLSVVSADGVLASRDFPVRGEIDNADLSALCRVAGGRADEVRTLEPVVKMYSRDYISGVRRTQTIDQTQFRVNRESRLLSSPLREAGECVSELRRHLDQDPPENVIRESAICR